ncbi:hypothetical protein MLD38_037092 [Melastoma candidum]|uniref:Uncharacterized protein n=1 Tax=Melastoma candidum TaxID=119954 RepID=A0ACB9LM50_9MYRT|nr:hypothetical protein MLD38_037092 [Melastoma candidum]
MDMMSLRARARKLKQRSAILFIIAGNHTYNWTLRDQINRVTASLWETTPPPQKKKKSNARSETQASKHLHVSGGPCYKHKQRTASTTTTAGSLSQTSPSDVAIKAQGTEDASSQL